MKTVRSVKIEERARIAAQIRARSGLCREQASRLRRSGLPKEHEPKTTERIRVLMGQAEILEIVATEVERG